jgi:hypothetical protein
MTHLRRSCRLVNILLDFRITLCYIENIVSASQGASETITRCVLWKNPLSGLVFSRCTHGGRRKGCASSDWGFFFGRF